MRKTGELFLLFNTGVDFSLRNNFANSGSFAKVPVHIDNSSAKLTMFVGVVALRYQHHITHVLCVWITE